MDPLSALVFLAVVLAACLAIYFFMLLWPLFVMAAPILVLFWLFLHFVH